LAVSHLPTEAHTYCGEGSKQRRITAWIEDSEAEKQHGARNHGAKGSAADKATESPTEHHGNGGQKKAKARRSGWHGKILPNTSGLEQFAEFQEGIPIAACCHGGQSFIEIGIGQFRPANPPRIVNIDFLPNKLELVGMKLRNVQWRTRRKALQKKNNEFGEI
jgi:hypothetical protein